MGNHFLNLPSAPSHPIEIIGIVRTNDIYRLMIFYVNFGIVAGESLTEKREQVLLWLTE
jgi:hypothetical protein